MWRASRSLGLVESRSVRFERRYDATPDEVWAALNEPERLGRWLADVAELELRVGGRRSDRPQF